MKCLEIPHYAYTHRCEQEPLVRAHAEQAEVKKQIAMLISQFEDSFDLTNFKDSTGQIKNNIKVDWSKFRTITVNQQLWYEFKVKEKQPASYENRKIKGRRYTLLATEHNNSVKFFLNKMLSYSDDGENTKYGTESVGEFIAKNIVDVDNDLNINDENIGLGKSTII